VTPEAVDRRWKLLGHARGAREVLYDRSAEEDRERYARNIENYIGTVRLPVGVIGPLRVNGTCAQGDYYVPLATTEAALVASYQRGATLLSLSGGCSAITLNEGMSRSPGFVFADLGEVGLFLQWVLGRTGDFRRAAEATTRHGRLIGFRVAVEGNHVYLIFDFTTGDASGQNMVTIATQAICDHIMARSPVKPSRCFVEANLSGDKKASAQSFGSVRGRKVTAEAVLSASLVRRILHTTPGVMVDYWRMSAIGGVLSGSIGIQGHYSNGLAAMFIACGQDAACVAEAAVGVTRFETAPEGSLYATVTLPNMIVGTVGGGTGLPTQKACLDILGLAGEGKTGILAEVGAALALAGELSVIGALCAGEFTSAHKRLARGPEE
jgi:hydroxymethylglutaryl-CoA reductase (NADPH)